MTLTECPVCGGILQATVRGQTWFTNSRFELRDGCISLVDLGDEDGGEADETSLYCENDHDEQQMAEAAIAS